MLLTVDLFFLCIRRVPSLPSVIVKVALVFSDNILAASFTDELSVISMASSSLILKKWQRSMKYHDCSINGAILFFQSNWRELGSKLIKIFLSITFCNNLL